MKRFKILFIAVLVLVLGFAMSTWDPPGTVAKTKITVTDQIQFPALAAVTSNSIEKDYLSGSGEVSATDCSIASVNKFITLNYMQKNKNINIIIYVKTQDVEEVRKPNPYYNMFVTRYFLNTTEEMVTVKGPGGSAFLRFSKTMGNQKIV